MPRTSWDRRKDRLARMTPEELTAWKARRNARERACYAKRTVAGQALEEAAMEEFLAGGAPIMGYSAFLQSKEAAKAAQLNYSLMDDERMAA